MRNTINITLLLIVLLAFCQCSKDNDSDLTETSNCNLTIPSGSLFTLYTPKLELLATIEIENDIVVLGTKTKYLNSGEITYRFKGLNIVFSNNVVVNDVIFTIGDNKITWLHFDDAKAAFLGEKYDLHFDDNGHPNRIDFISSDEMLYFFSYSTDKYSIGLNGSFIIN